MKPDQTQKTLQSPLTDALSTKILNEIHDAVVATDLDGFVTYWSHGAEELFGYEEPEAIGRHISFVYPESQQEFLRESVIQPLKTLGRHEVRVRMVRKTGGEFIAHLRLSLIFNDVDEATGMIGYSRDITAEVDATAALERRLKQQSAVARLGLDGLAGLDFDSLLSNACFLIAESLQVDYVKVLELLPNRTDLVLRAGVGWHDGLVGQALISGDENSQAGFTLQSKEPVIVHDLDSETRFCGPSLLKDHDIRSGISVIIQGRDKPYGVLGAHTTRLRTFTSHGIDFLQAMANVIAAAYERREMESSLRESEQRFRELADNIEETFWIADLESGDITYASQAFEHIWSLPLQALYEDPRIRFEAIVSEDQDAVREQYVPNHLAQGQFDVEYRIRRPDGSVRWIRDKGYPIRDAEQRVTRIAGIAQDITEQKAAEETLRRQSELLDIAHDAIFTRDLKNRRISYWNRAAERLYGWSREEALGQLPEDLLMTKFPQPLSELEAALNRTGHWEGELLQRRRDGTGIVVHGEWSLQRDERGEPIALLEINSEVETEGRLTKQELEHFMALVDGSPVAILAVDTNSTIIYADREAWEFFGFEQQAGMRLDELEKAAAMRDLESREYEIENWPLRRALQMGEYVRAEEMTFQFRDGRELTVLVNATPFFGSHGRVTAAVATIQDLSPVEQLERKRHEFLNLVTHELKTPLTVIKGAAAFALDGKLERDPSQIREMFKMVDDQVDRLQQLIGNLSDSARIESGAFSVEPEILPLSPLLEEAVKTFEQGASGLQIELKQEREAPAVAVDSLRFTQVLHNLLSNAAKYSPAGAPITVSTDYDDLQATISVSDEGPGIEKDLLPKLFKKYSRLDSAPGIPGAGLGLYISKGIVEAHGGRIWAQNNAHGSGAVFAFTLPVAAEKPTQAPTSSIAAGDEQPRIKPATAPRRRILVIDDDVQILRLLRRSLQPAGFEVIVTGYPEQGLGFVEAESPSLVLLDLSLPHMDGFEVLKRIREFSSVPVIVLTASGREEDLVKALRLGADDYVAKPFSLSELTARIEACIRAHSLSAPAENRPPFVLGELLVDFSERMVSVSQQEVHLSANEYQLLYELVTNAGRVLTHDQLLTRVWGEAYVGERELLRSLVRRLRRKLGEDVRKPRYIFSEAQVGYRVPKPKE